MVMKKNKEMIMQITETLLQQNLIDMTRFSSRVEAAGHVAVVIEKSFFEDDSRECDTEEDKEGTKE